MVCIFGELINIHEICLIQVFVTLNLSWVDSSQRSEATQYPGVDAEHTWACEGHDLRLRPMQEAGSGQTQLQQEVWGPRH